MYEAFNSFLATDTWHTANDEERFFKALALEVGKPDFNADSMGAYMRSRCGIHRYDDVNVAFNHAIDRYVAAAWAVREYLRATSQIR
jgi:hypothetical protein